MYKKPAGEQREGRWAGSCRLQAPLPPQLQYRQRGSYQTVLSMLSLLWGHCIFALLCDRHEKSIFSKHVLKLFTAQLWQAWPFCCRAGILWIQLLCSCEGLWCFLKGALCLIALHTLHHGCFSSFLTEQWLTGNSFYCGAWLKSTLHPSFFMVNFSTTYDNISVTFSFGGYGTAMFWLCYCIFEYTVYLTSVW